MDVEESNLSKKSEVKQNGSVNKVGLCNGNHIEEMETEEQEKDNIPSESSDNLKPKANGVQDMEIDSNVVVEKNLETDQDQTMSKECDQKENLEDEDLEKNVALSSQLSNTDVKNGPSEEKHLDKELVSPKDASNGEKELSRSNSPDNSDKSPSEALVGDKSIPDQATDEKSPPKSPIDKPISQSVDSTSDQKSGDINNSPPHLVVAVKSTSDKAAGEKNPKKAETDNASLLEPESPNEKKKDKKISKVTQVLKDASLEVTNLRPIAQILFDIGMDVTRQYVYRDLIKIQKKKESMDKLDEKEKEQLDKLQDAHDELILKNQSYIHDFIVCQHCNYKTDLKNVLELHKEYAHNQEYNMFTCSFCNESTKVASQYLYHMELIHNRKGRIFMKHSFFICPYCPYESNNRGPFQKHIEKCTRHFREKNNLIPLAPDCDIPLKAPPKPVVLEKKQAAISQAQQLAAQRAKVAQQTAQQQIAQAKAAISMIRMQAARKPTPFPQRPPTSIIQPQIMQRPPIPRPPISRPPVSRPVPVAPPVRAPVTQSPPNNVKDAAGTLVQMNGQWYRLAMIGSQQFLMPVPAPSVNQMPQKNPIVIQAENTPQTSAGAAKVPLPQKDFEVCEICGGFVKDRDSLRLHFFCAHKVDIHKDIFKSPQPPLACALCSKTKRTVKFWTYQGLSRHRSLEHKLDKENAPSQNSLIREIPKKCVVCNTTYSNTLTVEQYWSHMEIHGITPVKLFLLRKCLICGLSIGDPKQLEKHLLSAHSSLFKNVSLQNKKNDNKERTPTKNKLTICNLCSISFSTVESYFSHCNQVHVFKCSRCPEKLNNRDTLMKHFHDIHADERDPCCICNQVIRIGRPMVRHMKSEHIKACSVQLTRLPKSKVEPYVKKRKLEMDSEVLVSGKSSRKSKTPLKLNQRRRSSRQSRDNEIIVVDIDSPIKPVVPVSKCNDAKEPASKKQILEVDGEEIVVEIQQEESDDGDKINSEEEDIVENKVQDHAEAHSSNNKADKANDDNDDDMDEVCVELIDDENSKESFADKEDESVTVESNSSDIQQIEIESDDNDSDADVEEVKQSEINDSNSKQEEKRDEDECLNTSDSQDKGNDHTDVKNGSVIDIDSNADKEEEKDFDSDDDNEVKDDQNCKKPLELSDNAAEGSTGSTDNVEKMES